MWLPGHDAVVFVAVRVPAAEVWQVTRSGRATRLGGGHATCRPFAFQRGDTTWVGAIRGAKAGELWLAPVRGDATVDMTRARMTPVPRTLMRDRRRGVARRQARGLHQRRAHQRSVDARTAGWRGRWRALAPCAARRAPPALQRVRDVTGWHAARVHHVFTSRLSPDFRRYFFTSDDAGEPGVWMADVEGTAPPVRVARGASFGAWSTDGRQIAVQQMRGWRTCVGVVRPGAHDGRPLVTDADHAWPNDWSPDDRHIVYAVLRAGRWAIEAVEVATGRVMRLTPPGAATEYVRWPVWSARGDRIVYERGYWTGNVWVAALPETQAIAGFQELQNSISTANLQERRGGGEILKVSNSEIADPRPAVA